MPRVSPPRKTPIEYANDAARRRHIKPFLRMPAGFTAAQALAIPKIYSLSCSEKPSRAI